MGRVIGAVAALLVTPVLLLSAAAAGILGTDDDPATQPVASGSALNDVPPAMLVLYQRAASAECDGLPWRVLAAIGKVESDHGRSTLPGVQRGANAAGAQVIYGRSRRWARERSGATRPCLAGISWVCGT